MYFYGHAPNWSIGVTRKAGWRGEIVIRSLRWWLQNLLWRHYGQPPTKFTFPLSLNYIFSMTKLISMTKLNRSSINRSWIEKMYFTSVQPRGHKCRFSVISGHQVHFVPIRHNTMFLVSLYTTEANEQVVERSMVERPLARWPQWCS